MVSGALAIILVVLIAIAVIAALIPGRRRRLAVEEARHPVLMRYRVTSGVWRALGALAGVVAAGVLIIAEPAYNGRGLGLIAAPVILALALMVATLVGDMVARGSLRPRAADTAAPAAPGRPRPGYLVPGALLAAVGATTLALFALLATAWATGSPDGRGVAGRSFHVASPGGFMGEQDGVWPGRFYGIWAMPAVIVVLVLLAVAIAGVMLRRRVAADPELVESDDVARRSEVEALVGSAGLGISLLTVGVAMQMAAVLMGVRDAAQDSGFDPGVGYDLAGWICLAVALAAFAVLIWSTISLLLPGSAPTRHRRETTAAARDREVVAA